MRRLSCKPAVDVAILLLGTAVSLGNARAEGLMDVPAAAPMAVTEGRDLQLNILIHERAVNLIGSFRRLPDGSLATTPKELREIGLLPPKGSEDSENLVALNQLPGVTYRVDEATQSVAITAPDRARVPYSVNLRPAFDESIPPPQRNYGGVLNYTLFASSDGPFWRDLKTFQGVSGAFDARVFSPYGTLSQSLIASTGSPSIDNFVRLDTKWTYSDMDQLITYRAGDVISGGLSWTRPYRLGGLQMQRSFGLRPDLVTMPIPSLSGSAAVPSTLDVYSQNAKVFSGPIPPGPFQLTNFPIVTGAGTASVVVSDALGRQAVTTLPFYASNQLLREGLYDFSGELGFARRFYGIESDNYDPRPMASLSARYGLTNWLTLEGHAEAGEGLFNGGAGATFSLGPIGVASLAAAGSQTGGRTGGLLNASLEMAYRGVSFYARTQRTIGDYEDIASVTAPVLDPKFKEFSYLSARVPKSLDQVSLGVPLPFDRSSLNLSYTQLESALGDRNRIVGLSYSRNIFANSTLFASAFKDLDDTKSFGVFAGISMPLGNDVTMTAGAQHTPNGPSSVVDAIKSERLEEGSYGWRVRDAEGSTVDRSASASYRSSFGRTEASVQQYGSNTRGTAQFDGSIVFAGGGLFFGN
ncbi:outer membrane usher protein [Bradyrhizobium sp. LM2.7]